jgi:hypothetical protein
VLEEAVRGPASREAVAAETEMLFGLFASEGDIPSRPVARKKIAEVNILIVSLKSN